MAGAPIADGRTVLVGEGRLADVTQSALVAAGSEVTRLHDPNDREIREALGGDVARLVVASRFDHVSLRLALIAAHISPGIPTLVTIFDRLTARRARREPHRSPPLHRCSGRAGSPPVGH